MIGWTEEREAGDGVRRVMPSRWPTWPTWPRPGKGSFTLLGQLGQVGRGLRSEASTQPCYRHRFVG